MDTYYIVQIYTDKGTVEEAIITCGFATAERIEEEISEFGHSCFKNQILVKIEKF